MTERWSEVQTLFESAIDRPREERITWLQGTCDDPQLRAEVERLLRAHERADGILDTPASLTPESLNVRGQRIGPYRLVREIGRGGMSVVYLAEREDPYRQRVAVKLLRPGLATSDLVRRFLAERQILATLDHPSIARLLDGGVSDDGRPYFVMELVEGKPITDYCDAHRLSVDDRLALFERVCEAVQYAHRNLVVHRDLKPSNILVTEDGEVKLLDFGIAKLLDPEAVPTAVPHTRTGFRPMTPEYAAPEQVRGEPITTATDVYTLGVVLYELLAGRRPYRVAERTPSEIERVIAEHEPPPPSSAVETEDGTSPEEVAHARDVLVGELQRALRGDLDTIVQKALRKEAERRYASAEQFAADIERYRSGQPVKARPATVRYRVRKFAQRHRGGVAVAVLFVLLLGGYAATVTLQAQRIAEERDRARLEAMKTLHVKDFLIELFGSVGPSAGDSAALTEVLAGGADRVRRDLADHPEIRAEMLSALGAVYERLGQTDAARPLVEEALAARRSSFDEPHAEVAADLRDLAALEQQAGRPGRAESLYRDALAQLRAVRGEGHVAVAQAQHDLAALLESDGQRSEAASLYADALPVYRRELGSAHGQTAALLTSLAALRCEAGNAEAVSLYEEALALELERLGEQHEALDTIRADLRACRNSLSR
jgi:serine/threonine protein kinase